MSVTFFPSDAGEQSPELNVANGNVSIVFDILGFAFTEDDYCGSIPNSELKKYLKNVITADLRGMERETNRVGNWFFCGVDADRVSQYKERLVQIISYCIAFDKSLMWS